MADQADGPNKIDWGNAYLSLRPVLMTILRRLVNQGYVSTAGQGIDLVHDFFVEVWPGLIERYEPSRAPLKVYAAAAFARFARPRLVREARWQQALSGDPPEVEESGADPGEGVDLQRVREALEQLPTADREILAQRFGTDGVSERKLADGLGMSRYMFRERVAEALARVAILLGEAGALGRTDFEIARLLFAEEQAAGDVSIELRLPVSRVRTARRRILHALGKASLEASI